METTGERITEDFGDLDITLLRKPNETTWQIVSNGILGSEKPYSLRFKDNLEQLRTEQKFGSIEEAIAFASRQLRLELRTDGENNKFQVAGNETEGFHLLQRVRCPECGQTSITQLGFRRNLNNSGQIGTNDRDQRVLSTDLSLQCNSCGHVFMKRFEAN